MEQIIKNIDKVKKETEDYIYMQFETLCMDEKYTIEEIESFINTFNIDVNKEDGCYVSLICGRNDLPLLEMFLKYGANVHLNDDSVLKMCAHRGLLDMVHFLLNDCQCNHKVLYGTTAYSNYKCIKDYIDQYDVAHNEL